MRQDGVAEFISASYNNSVRKKACAKTVFVSL